jgi:hypothetical protein
MFSIFSSLDYTPIDTISHICSGHGRAVKHVAFLECVKFHIFKRNASVSCFEKSKKALSTFQIQRFLLIIFFHTTDIDAIEEFENSSHVGPLFASPKPSQTKRIQFAA